jgi:hypothetical protein
MSHYVIIDGQLQKRSAATESWAKRVAKAQPSNAEETPDVVALPKDNRSDWEILESLEEKE